MAGFKDPPKDTQFKKGMKKTGGRKKGTKNKATEIKELLEAVVEIELKDGTVKKGVAMDLLIMAAIEKGITTGDMTAINSMMDRFYGKVADKVEQKVEGEHSIKVEYVD